MKKRLTWIALLGAFAIILGAFGAHGLKEKVSPKTWIAIFIGFIKPDSFHNF